MTPSPTLVENLKKNWFAVSKPTKFFGEFLSEHSKVSKIYTLIGSLRESYVMFDLKKYRGVSLMTLESDAKFEEKLICGLENNMRNLANFHQSTWKLELKIGTFPIRKYNELKIHREVMCYDNEESIWKAIEKELTSSKLTWGIYQMLTQTLENLKNLHFNGLLFIKVYNAPA